MPNPMRQFAAAAAILSLLTLPALAAGYEGKVERVEKPPEKKPPVLTRAPELLKFVEADYPEEAVKEGLTGDVGMIIDIAADGTVANAMLEKSAGHGFDEAAIKAIKQFLFSPAELDGVPAPVRIEYVYKFVLKEAPPPVVNPESPLPEAPESLKGHVIERANRKPVVGANVHCDETGEGVMTDSQGAFSLHLSPGSYNVRVAAGGYQPFHRTEVIEPGKALDVTYHLMPVTYGLFQTVVRAERDKRDATEHTLEREELQKIPGTMGDPIRVVQNMPGVARAPYLGGQLIVRGASPAETGTYLDSVEIPLLFHFLGGPSVVNPEFLDRLEFFPGGFGPRYGRAIGGIIDAYTRRGAADSYHGNLKIDLLDTALFLEAPIGDSFSVAGAARRSYIDAILPSVVGAFTSNQSISILPVYWDYQVRADYGKKGDKNQLTLMAFGSDDRMAVAASGVGSIKTDQIKLNFRTNFHRVRLGWLYHDGDLTNLLVANFGRDEIGGGLDTGGPVNFDGNGITWAGGVRDELAYSLPGGHVARLGLDVMFYNTDISITIPPLPEYRTFPGADPVSVMNAVNMTRSMREADWGFYTEWELKLTDRLTVIPGLRIDEFHYAGKTVSGTDPRLIARFKMLDKTPIGISTVLKGSIGHYSMAPPSLDADKQIGNPNLGLEKAFQASVGFEHKFSDVVDLEVTGFYNRRYDLVVGSSNIIVGADGNPRPENYNNDGLGRAYGVEVMLRHNITSRFFGWIAYTFSRTEERRRGDPTYVAGSYDEPHILTLVGEYNIGWGFSVGARFRLVSGRPATPVVGSSFDADTSSYTAVYGPSRSDRDPLFHQLDLRIDKDFLFNNWKFGIYIDVQNVYNAKNTEAFQWDYRYHVRADIPGIPIIPTLGLKGSF